MANLSALLPAMPGMRAIFRAVHPNRNLWWAAAIVAMLCIEGCADWDWFRQLLLLPYVTAVKIDPAEPCIGEPCDAIAILNRPVKVTVSGRNACKLVSLKFGDGKSVSGIDINFGQYGAKEWVVNHTYSGWPGPKTITAEGLNGCRGSATQRISVLKPGPQSPRNVLRVGYSPRGQTCAIVPDVFPLRKKTRVVLDASSNSFTAVNFCDPFGRCHASPFGTGNAAPEGYPFPGFRELSLILRVGTQVVQGGFRVDFITTQSGFLELCVNDYNVSDNGGAWLNLILVDESLAP